MGAEGGGKKTEARTQGQDGDVGWPVGAQQGVFPCLVERCLLVEHALHGPHHGLEAMHAEGECLVGLAVPVTLLPKEGPRLLSQSQGLSLATPYRKGSARRH